MHATTTLWRAHPHLYQIHTWAWLDQLSEQAGRRLQLKDIPDQEWDRLQALGFDLVYLLGIWQRSTAGRHIFRTDSAAFRVFDHALPGWTLENVIGSPFSIHDYVPDARIGDWAQLDAVRAKLHARGMRLILDFVPNHTGPDHVWIDSHPEYFLQGRESDFQQNPSAFHLLDADERTPLFIARGRDPYFAPWADTAQLDYFNPATRQAMIETLQEISRHCDGVRCDMAMLVLNEIFAKTWQPLLHGRTAPVEEFWPQAIRALPSDFLWMAEVYWDMEWQLQQLGFHFTYDKKLYDRLHGAPADEIKGHLHADPAYQTHMARFLENHDEPRSAKIFGLARLPSLITLLCTLPGLRFFHQGQFEGKTMHLPMPLNRVKPEAPNALLQKIHERLLNIADHAVFHHGEWKLLEVTPDSDASHTQLLAYRWREQDEYRLVVINLSEHIAQGRIRFADEINIAQRYQLHDLLHETQYQWQREDLLQQGLYVRLEAFGAHLFTITPD